MSDAAKAKRRKRRASAATAKLETSVKDNKTRQKQGKKPRTIAGAAADKLVDSFRSNTLKAKRLEGQGARMLAKARKVDESGTGNKKAAATYRQTAEGYRKQAEALRRKK